MSEGSESAFVSAVHYRRPDPNWLRQWREEILDPEQPIFDAHHHLWDRPDERYLLDEFLADAGSGHRIVGSMFVECSAMFRPDGPVGMRAVGEIEFANGIAAMSASGGYGSTRVAAGLVGFADLHMGAGVDEILATQVRAAGGRLAGIRQMSVWDEDVTLRGKQAPPKVPPVPGMLSDPRFRDGFRQLAANKLVFDAWVYQRQLPELEELARAFPETRIVIDHFGGVMRVGEYKLAPEENFRNWAETISAIARRPNCVMKIGGLGNRMCGFEYDARPSPPSSEELARDWEPYVRRCLDTFGPERCMFETNFPVDKASFTYAANWNAFKRLAAPLSAAGRDRLFFGTALEVYGLKPWW